MPSLRKRVSSYFRQLSFYNEPRERSHNVNENSFITKYLEGNISLKEGPPILYGKNLTDLPNYDLGLYNVGRDSTIGCFSGPNGGLTTIKRLEKHLSIPDTDIDYIDTQDEVAEVAVVKSPVNKSPVNNKVDNMTMLIKVAGQEYLVTNSKKHATTNNKSNSLSSLSDLEIEKTKICVINNNDEEVKCKNQELIMTQNDATNQVSCALIEKTVDTDTNKTRQSLRRKSKSPERTNRNYAVARSRSDGTPFVNKKKGKITKISNRPSSAHVTTTEQTPDPNLPGEWNHKTDCIYGISDSLYDKNLITQFKNGDPIADCFGIIARKDSAILAVADGVNWGEKACIAAKSAVHGCLHYLDKTIFNDTKPFDNLCQNEVAADNSVINHYRINSTRDVFVCLLRAFNCAHDLILENEGMLTTLTVAVVLPLKPKNIKPVNKFRDHRGDSLHRGRAERLSARQNEDAQSYVCCVCNVGDTLAYVYSQQYGIRELTKGSHDVNCNRDMRDALGALGPVDGINPELSNLTLSITTVQKGDIILVASDGLTDNFDPNVCKFTVNAKDSLRPKRPSQQTTQPSHNKENVKTVPVKPPRKNKDNPVRTSRDRSVESTSKPSSSRPKSEEYDNPLIAQFMHENALDKTHKPKPSQIKSAPVTRSIPVQPSTNFLRSKTSIEMRTSAKTILRNDDGIPYVTPMQRYEISLLLMEDVLKHGISGHEVPCTTARKLCENLVKFAFSISSAKRHTLEDSDLYYNSVNGVLVEISHNEKKVRRKKGLERVQNLPGKLDHVTVVAYNVGNFVC